MTNETIPNVPRELLERVLYLMDNYIGTTHPEEDEIRAILSAPSPDGGGGLEVIGWYTDDHLDDKSATTYSRKVADRWLAKGWPVTGIANESDAQAIIDGLRGEVAAQRVKTCTALKERNDAREERDAAATECERLRMQLAACGVVALSNTIESAGKARQMHPDYMSASCSDVAGAVDREIALRTERDQQAQRIGELEGLLRHAQKQVPTGSGLHMRIDAALSADKEGE